MDAIAVAKNLRPQPPVDLLDELAPEMFLASGELQKFVGRTLLNEFSPLWNQDHAHLVGAEIGFLWTNVLNMRQQRHICATAEIPKPPLGGNAWAKAKYRVQMDQWFGRNAIENLDFLITVDANYASAASDVVFLALLDHELYHCAQALDEFQAPKFSKDGRPVFAMIGHDVEEFVGIWRRYGPQAGAGASSELFTAGWSSPEIAEADVKSVCGSCG